MYILYGLSNYQKPLVNLYVAFALIPSKFRKFLASYLICAHMKAKEAPLILILLNNPQLWANICAVLELRVYFVWFI